MQNIGAKIESLIDSIEDGEVKDRVVQGTMYNIIGYCSRPGKDSISFETILEFIKMNVKNK